VNWLHGDWYDPIGARYDVIVSNPPYIRSGDPHLGALAHEPRIALVGGVDGLDSLRVIIGGAAAHLTPHGWLIVEHGFDQADAVRALFHAADFSAIGTVADLGGNDRATLGRQ
jgi:release factor glutamine methyltransferase